MSDSRIEKFDITAELLNDLVVFDLETTGLSPHSSEIIQIAAIRIFNSSIITEEPFISYVKPVNDIPYFITRLTGITNDHVKDAPDPVRVLRAFSRFCGSSLLVGHNAHRFDMQFLKAACGQRTRKIREVEYIDSMHLSWLLWGRTPGQSHSLDSVLSRLKISERGFRRHDALNDVYLTAKCIVELLKRLNRHKEERAITIFKGVIPGH